MKTRKRKRSTKAAMATEAMGVDVVVADTLLVDEPVVDAAELSPTAVEALVAEPVVAADTDIYAAAEPVVETTDAPVVDVAAGTVVLETAADETVVVAESVVEEVAAEQVDATPDTLVAEIAESVAVAAETVVAPESTNTEPMPAGEPIVVMAANCSVKDAAALKVSLCAIANQSIDVTLDVSAVERVDTATMQLLCAFVRDRSGRQQNVIWRGESQALQDAVRLLGVGALLGFEPKGVAA